MKFFCFHSDGWSKVDEHGYQYCSTCGIAQAAPAPPPPPPVAECEHPKKVVIDKLENVSRISKTIIKITYVLQCETCGELTNHVAEPGRW